MIFYALLAMTMGIVSAVVTVSTWWFWLLQGVFVLFIQRFPAAILCVLVGMNYGAWRWHHMLSWQLPVTWIKQPLVFRGVIASLPKVTDHFQEFAFKTLGHDFRIDWYQTKIPVHYGDQWRFTLSLKPPSGLYNPGGFDYGRWLILQGIQATGYVKSQPPAELLYRPQKTTITRWREGLQAEVADAIPNQEIAGLITALTIGSHAAIQASQWPVFQKTGTNHLMAISGLHIGFVAGFGFLVMGFLWRRSYCLMLWQPVQYAAAMGAIIAAIFYGVMAGFSLPTQRAVIMVVVVMLAVLMKQEIPMWQRIVFAFCVVVILNPADLYSASLWLSFGSVAWIAYVCVGRSYTHTRIEQWLRLQIALLIGLAPLTLFYYHQVSLIGFVANALAVPWVGFLVVPVCLLAAITSLVSITSSQYLFIFAGKLMLPVWHYLKWLAGQHYAVYTHVIPSMWVLLLALFGLVVLLMPMRKRGRWWGLLCLVPMFFYQLPGPSEGALWVTTLDVGQGLSVVVRTAHHTLLYDAGPKSYSGFDAGVSVVVPYLQYQGIQKLDLMMISHGDSDHRGGAPAVLAALSTSAILTSVPWTFKPIGAPCYRGQHWRWDGVDFDVLWPLKNTPYADNNSSCVLRIRDGHQAVLLTGDIEASVESWLVKNSAHQLRATELLAPHHGSKTSSTLDFIRAVRPQLVVFPTGAYNRFHFPSRIVVDRYRNMHVTMYNTASQGAVTAYFKNSAIEKLKTARDAQKSLL